MDALLNDRGVDEEGRECNSDFVSSWRREQNRRQLNEKKQKRLGSKFRLQRQWCADVLLPVLSKTLSLVSTVFVEKKRGSFSLDLSTCSDP
jgi:hypothetical protein